MKKYKLNKKQTQKILATVVMGMNVMNTIRISNITDFK